MSNRHVNNGNCEKCDELFDLYPGFHEGLRNWFKALQKKNPDAHISCAGRGQKEQEECFKKKTSRALYGQSAHNYNVALDLFRLTHLGASWDAVWFRNVVGTAVYNANREPDRRFEIEWYGQPGSKFFELPHCEVEGWRSLNLSLVEPVASTDPVIPQAR